MRLGASIDPEANLIKRLENLPPGLDFVELPIGEMERPTEEVDRERLCQTLEKEEYDLVVHLPFSQPVVTRVEEFNRSEKDYLKRLIEFSESINAEKAVLHPNKRYREDGDIIPEFRKQLEEINEICRENGIELCVENMPNRVPTVANNFELVEILEDLDISMCFDTGHGYASMGQDEMEEFLEEYSGIVSHLHLQDTREGKDLHLPIGSAEIDFDSIGEKLTDFDGTATMEIFTDDRDYIELSMQKVREKF